MANGKILHVSPFGPDRLATGEIAKTVVAIKEAEQRTAEAKAALEAECAKRVPSQSTDNLKELYSRCLTENAGLFGVSTP